LIPIPIINQWISTIVHHYILTMINNPSSNNYDWD
jgi:Ca2+-dependent lipid-binding protein